MAWKGKKVPRMTYQRGALKYWSTHLLFCVDFVAIANKLLIVGESVKAPKRKGLALAKDKKIFFVCFALRRSEKNNPHKKSVMNLQDFCMSTFAENCC